MSRIGIGHATPFAMPSNHPTALNHAFRDVSSYDPRKQVKEKCGYCGCWTVKGKNCYFCKRTPHFVYAPRDNSIKVDPAPAATLSFASIRRPRSASRPRERSEPRASPVPPPATVTPRPRETPRATSRPPAEERHDSAPQTARPRTPQRSGSASRPQTAAAPPTAWPHSASHSVDESHQTANTTGVVFSNGTFRYQNALTHKFRDEASQLPTTAMPKIKCKSCGCWATKGKPCYLCRTFTR